MGKLSVQSFFKLQQKRELLVAACCSFLILSIVLYFSKTGIDLFDEGYYLLGYDKQQDIYFQFTGFHFLVRVLPFSDHLVIVRIYRILFLVLAAYVLARSLHKHVFTSFSFAYVFFYALLGNLLTYVHCPASLSYNTLSVIFIELLLAAYLAFRTTALSWNQSAILPVILFGIILSLQAFNKPTSALLLAMLVCIDLFFCRKTSLRAYFLLVAVIGAVSLFSFLLLVYACYGSHITEILRLLQQPENPFSEGHLDTGFMFGQLFINTIVQSKKFLVFTLCYLLFHFLLKHFRLQHSVLANVLFSGITLFVFYQYKSIYYGQPGAEYFYAFFLFFCIVWLLHRKKLSTDQKSEARFSVFLILLLLPFAGFWGSNNPPMLGIIHYMVFPLLLVVYMNQWIQLRFLPVMVVLITGFTIYNYTWAPFYNPPVFQQKNTLSVRGTNIQVSNYVFSEANKFNVIHPFINKEAPLIPAGVPNGLLYINQLRAYYTIHFNSPEFTAGYLRLLQQKSIPANAQLLLYKTEKSEQVKKAVSAFLENASKQGLLALNVHETAEYQLIRFKKEKIDQ